MSKQPAKEVIVRDPIHGFVRLDLFDFIKPVVDTPTFQRLRALSQTGVSWVTYPTATHNRFSHSLGNVHVFHEILDRLLKQEGVAKEESEHLLRLGCACALLHDVGHGPLSHVSERIFGFSHEEISRELILDGEIAAILEKYKVDRKEMVKVLDGTVTGWEGVISQFISSQLDSDRLDYLSRDAYFTGIGFGNIDLPRIINLFRIHHGEGVLKGSAVCLNKSRYTLESYVITRHSMYQEVYLHKTTRGAEQLLISATKRMKDLGQQKAKVPEELSFLFEAREITASDILPLNDHSYLAAIARLAKSDDPVLSELCERFVQRNLLKPITLPRPDLAKWRATEQKLQALAKSNGIDGDYFCLYDSCKATPYTPYRATSPEDQGTITSNIFLYDQQGKPEEISSASPDVVRNLVQAVYSDRLYVPERILSDARSLYLK